ncbi:helix-turn-helix domain-containing protein [Blautia sp. MCC269]|nr:helix-turn-helix transcriptional regulator [Blautia sp. MCC269]MBT9803128.1 helix-turn-helix domain-containing protein [Blautia sp. MCC269]
MIKYDRFWVTMKERGITQYDLYEHYEITRSLLDRLRKNKNIEIFTIDRLCSILHCDIEDIVEHIPDPDEMNNNPKEVSEKNNSSSENEKNSL